MADYNVLKEYYIRYLRDVRGSSEATVNHYVGALTTISKYLVEHGKIRESIYEVDEYDELEILRSYIFSDPEFAAKDERGRRMYSAGLNNYLRFASGTEFKENDSLKFAVLDFSVPVGEKESTNVTRWKRNGIIKKQSIEIAHYECETDKSHQTFISAATGRPYMEGHHAIPIRKQDMFGVSLDIYANIVCLCPVCHRLLHYGMQSDKEIILNKIYNDRSERYAKSGIYLSKKEFISVVNV